MGLIINEFGDGLNAVRVYFSTLAGKWNVEGYKWEANGFETYEEAYSFARGVSQNE